LNRGPAKPTLVPPRPFQKGVGGKPTLVQNVETLAAVALVARYGSEWYRAVGDTNEPGTRLLTVSGAVAAPGVYEVPCGLSPAAVVDAAGGATHPIQAFLFGGYFGSWMTASQAWQIPLTEAAIRGARGSLGCGVIVALPAEACGVIEVARVARYLADETAGQCGPCVHGLASIATEVEALASSAGANLDRVFRWIDQIQGRGACHHPDGALRFIASGLRAFADDVEGHRRREPCRARERRAVLPIPMSRDAWR
jgi:NADH:ubiquinone oxidoreductase subunit F (NADH-binding)